MTACFSFEQHGILIPWWIRCWLQVRPSDQHDLSNQKSTLLDSDRGWHVAGTWLISAFFIWLSGGSFLEKNIPPWPSNDTQPRATSLRLETLLTKREDQSFACVLLKLFWQKIGRTAGYDISDVKRTLTNLSVCEHEYWVSKINYRHR